MVAGDVARCLTGWISDWMLDLELGGFCVMGFDGAEDSGYDEAGHHRVLCKWIM